MANLAFSHGGDIYEVKRKFKGEVIDFSANINPLGLPAAVKKVLCENFNKILHYPDPWGRNITERIAKYWQINKENILLGNGSSELIYLIISAFRPKTALIPVPSFSEYERALGSINSKIQFLKLKEKEGFSFNIGPAEKTDIFFIGNPNNPTGNLILPSLRAKQSNPILRLLRPGGARNDSSKLVVDEAFMDFLPNQKDYTLIWRAVKNRKIIVLRSFTKFFALPGLRIGYIVAHKEVVNKLRQCQPPWSVNSLAQLAAELILDDKDYIKKTYKLINKEREFLFEQLTGIEGLKPYPPAANFLLVKIEKAGVTSKFLKEALIKKGILIRDCGNFRNLNNKYIRVAVRSREENLKLLKGFKGILQKKEGFYAQSEDKS
ncbi:MAG: threonine-phosphate decarboxylase [Candidatus Omnitrophica bacterium]|nr:threonine-phosphate decarboxylase [Candidatus Omnitrophota bacterium]